MLLLNILMVPNCCNLHWNFLYYTEFSVFFALQHCQFSYNMTRNVRQANLARIKYLAFIYLFVCLFVFGLLFVGLVPADWVTSSEPTCLWTQATSAGTGCSRKSTFFAKYCFTPLCIAIVCWPVASSICTFEQLSAIG